MTHVITVFGAPQAILSDCGREFTGAGWDHLGKIFGYKVLHTNPYHPQNNGQVEWLHCTISNRLRALISEKSSLPG